MADVGAGFISMPGYTVGACANLMEPNVCKTAQMGAEKE